MKRVYVSLDGVSEETLNFLGYYCIGENEEFKIYYHKGEEIIVDKSKPYILVDDLNDAKLFGNEVIEISKTGN